MLLSLVPICAISPITIGAKQDATGIGNAYQAHARVYRNIANCQALANIASGAYRAPGLRRSPGPLLLTPPGRSHLRTEYITSLATVKPHRLKYLYRCLKYQFIQRSRNRFHPVARSYLGQCIVD